MGYFDERGALPEPVPAATAVTRAADGTSPGGGVAGTETRRSAVDSLLDEAKGLRGLTLLRRSSVLEIALNRHNTYR